jgi:hypothetical protein
MTGKRLFTINKTNMSPTDIQEIRTKVGFEMHTYRKIYGSYSAHLLRKNVGIEKHTYRKIYGSYSAHLLRKNVGIEKH